MPTWRVKLTKDSKADFKKLDGREKTIVAKRLISLERDPGIGDPLGNKMGMDLTGYFKLYADGKRLRIVMFLREKSSRLSLSASVKRWKSTGWLSRELNK